MAIDQYRVIKSIISDETLIMRGEWLHIYNTYLSIIIICNMSTKHKKVNNHTLLWYYEYIQIKISNNAFA
jgi:hypothetical protein